MWLGMTFPVVGIAGGILLMQLKSPAWQMGVAVAVLGVVAIALLAWQMAVPRLASNRGELLIFLRTAVRFVCQRSLRNVFFSAAGPGKSLPPVAIGRCANLVLRVAEKAVDYQKREVTAVLGSWSEGYVTFHGAWCEPLNLEVVTNLNAKLSAVRESLQENGHANA